MNNEEQRPDASPQYAAPQDAQHAQSQQEAQQEPQEHSQQVPEPQVPEPQVSEPQVPEPQVPEHTQNAQPIQQTAPVQAQGTPFYAPNNSAYNDPNANPYASPYNQEQTYAYPRNDQTGAAWGNQSYPRPTPNGNPVWENGSTNGSTVREKRKNNGPGWGATIVIALICSLVVGLGAEAIGHFSHSAAEKPESSLFSPSQEKPMKPAPVKDSTSQNPNWEAVARAVRPSVVAIQVTTATEAGSGSGVILDDKGHILTNDHVVSSAASKGKIAVELLDGRIYTASITGRDVKTDLAVIKLDNPPKNLTMAVLGNSDKLQVGQSIVAIGNPLGLSSTVTTGIVSALDRPVIVQRSSSDDDDSQLPYQNPFLPRREVSARQAITTNAIQVDAAINPGNSGGPLFDAQGRVIGINSSIASLSSDSARQGGSIGLGFAIPINLAKRISSELIINGKADHASLGVRVIEQSISVGEVTRLGAKVVDVMPASSAARAGLRPGDVVVAIDDNRVTGASSLVGWVRRYAVGDKVKIQVVRDGKEVVLGAQLQSQNSE